MSEQKDRFRKALEQSRKGEPLGLSEEEFELFSAIQNEGCAKAYELGRKDLAETIKAIPQKRLDRPDRERIAYTQKDPTRQRIIKWLAEYDALITLPPISDTVDQIIALFPNEDEIIQTAITAYESTCEALIVEAKREKGERMIRILKDASYALDEKTWQALKEEK